MPKKITIVFIFLSVFLSNCFAQSKAVNETVIIINEDGDKYLFYESMRSNESSTSWVFNKSTPIESALDSYSYIYPNEYYWQTDSHPTHNFLILQAGDASFICEYPFSYQQNENDVMTYTYPQGIDFDGHIGDFYGNIGFTEYVIVWLFPKKFELLSWESNRVGEWVKRGNNLSFFSKNVNDILFNIKFRLKANRIYEAYCFRKMFVLKEFLV